MSEYLSDDLLKKLHAHDPVTENAKRHTPDFDGFFCLKCETDLYTPSEYDPSPLCPECLFKVLDALVLETITRREDANRRASEVDRPQVGRQRNARWRR